MPVCGFAVYEKKYGCSLLKLNAGICNKKLLPPLAKFEPAFPNFCDTPIYFHAEITKLIKNFVIALQFSIFVETFVTLSTI